MNKYEKMSDFEINVEVVKHLPLRINDLQSASLKSRSSSVLVNDIIHSYEFNPCLDSSDAWPIITENLISLTIADGQSWNADFLISIEEDRGNYNHFECISNCSARHDNPLRAAMMCFLMIKESAKC